MWGLRRGRSRGSGRGRKSRRQAKKLGGGREGGVRQSSSKERLVARREGEELWEGGEAVGEQ
jgi:hypothetical protein